MRQKTGHHLHSGSPFKGHAEDAQVRESLTYYFLHRKFQMPAQGIPNGCAGDFGRMRRGFFPVGSQRPDRYQTKINPTGFGKPGRMNTFFDIIGLHEKKWLIVIRKYLNLKTFIRLISNFYIILQIEIERLQYFFFFKKYRKQYMFLKCKK